VFASRLSAAGAKREGGLCSGGDGAAREVGIVRGDFAAGLSNLKPAGRKKIFGRRPARIGR